MSRHENQNKKPKKWCYVYRKFGTTQRFKSRFNIEETKERSQIRVMEVKKLHMERHYEGSHILFLESRAQSLSLQICISLFTNYSVSNIFGRS